MQIAARTDDESDTADDILLTTTQVARIFQKSPKTIRRWLRDGVLDGTRIGRDWYVTPGAVDRMVDRVGAEALNPGDVIDLRRRLQRFTDDDPA